MSATISLSRTLPLLVAVGLLVAVIVSAVVHLRSDFDPSLRPIMAEREIVMPNGRTLWVQQHEVTIAEWNTCAGQGACPFTLRSRPDQDPKKTPATGLSYVDVQQYISWINMRTGQKYRLPTAAEWNHMAASVLPDKPDPIFTDPSLSWASAYLTEGLKPRALKPQGSFSTSPEGIADLDGSVWEWTIECYDGTANGFDPDLCPAFFVGGEHVAVMSYLIRDPARGGCAVGSPPAHLGMRLVADKYPF